MLGRIAITCLAIFLLMALLTVGYAQTSYQHKAEVANALHQTIGVGRSTFSDRVTVTNPSLYIVPVPPQGKTPQVGEGTQIGVLTIELGNRSHAPVHLEVLEELRLVDSQGHVYAPSWVSYTDDTRKLISSVVTGEIDVNTYNPGVSQYRYVIFLLPPGQDSYRVASTDYSFSRDLPVSGPTPTPPPAPQGVPSPPVNH